MGDEVRTLIGYGRSMRRVLALAKRARALDQRYPLAADALLALVLAAAAFVSLAVTYSGIPVTDHAFSHGFTFTVVGRRWPSPFPWRGGGGIRSRSRLLWLSRS